MKILFSAIGLFAPVLLEKVFTGYLERGLDYIFTYIPWVSKWIYQRIAEDCPVNLSFYILLYLTVYTSLFLIYYKMSVPKITTKCKGICEECENRGTFKCVIKKLIECLSRYVGFSAIIITFWVLMGSFLLLTNYINHTTIRIKNNIEIIAPYISDQEYKEFRSEFHLMKDFNDYCLLMNNLDEIAVENGIELQE